MKKTGFTLAEVLVTIGIIGVVSAMVIPTFTAQTQAAKIGPSLGKAVAEFEQATKAMLDDAQVDAISRASVPAVGLCGENTVLTAPLCFAEYLSHHMKGTVVETIPEFIASNGVIYKFIGMDSGTRPSSPTLAHMRTIGRAFNSLVVDINGDSGPNRDSKDLFYFDVMDDGSLRPWGFSGETNQDDRWTAACQRNQKPIHATRCAGHIMENGLKAEYKL